MEQMTETGTPVSGMRTGNRKLKAWSEEELAQFLQLAPKHSPKELETLLGKNKNQIAGKLSWARASGLLKAIVARVKIEPTPRVQPAPVARVRLIAKPIQHFERLRLPPKPRRRTIVELKPDECKYAIGYSDPNPHNGLREHLFCGHTVKAVAAGYPYCEYHQEKVRRRPHGDPK